MQLVYFSLILNNHQVNVADELWKLTGHQYCFVELANLQAEHKKGDTRNYDECPYLLRAWESPENYAKAMDLARTAECCVFSGVQALPFQKERMKFGLLSFDMSERWLKQGLINVFSPAISKMFLAYWMGGWKNKPLYKLTCSAFAANDHYRLGMYKDKCFKWGYFTGVNSSMSQASSCNDGVVRLMWCSRYLKIKHPELAIELARLIKQGHVNFSLDMYGDGPLREDIENLAQRRGVSDVINFCGNVPNEQVYHAMGESDIFLLTSDRNEGWGAVANESLANGCVLVASDAVGSSPYLIKEGVNGFMFRSSKATSSFNKPDMEALNSLYEKVSWLIDHPIERKQMQQNAVMVMQEVWSPKIAAQSLLTLINDINNGKETSIKNGPCSIA